MRYVAIAPSTPGRAREGSIVNDARLDTRARKRPYGSAADYADLDPQVAIDLIAANHILVNNAVLDSFGHVSVRDPRNPEQYLQSQAIAPRDVTLADIITFDLDSKPLNARGR